MLELNQYTTRFIWVHFLQARFHSTDEGLNVSEEHTFTDVGISSQTEFPTLSRIKLKCSETEAVTNIKFNKFLNWIDLANERQQIQR